MKDFIKNRLHEELSRTDKEEVKNIVNNQIEKKLGGRELEAAVTKIVKDRIKGDKALEDKVVDITRNVITQLFKTFWVKRSFWKSQLKNKAS